MSNEIPANPRRAPVAEARKPVASDKTPEEVIQGAPLQTISAEQTNPTQGKNPKKPWLDGYSMSEAELTNLTTKKSFNFKLITQAKMDFYLEMKKKEGRTVGRSKLNETEIVQEALDKFFSAEFKRMGFDPK